MTDTHNLIVDFGAHAGRPWTRTPVSWLLHIIRQGHPQAHLAQAELDRRGVAIANMDISNHAINRASLDCWDLYRRTRGEGEGLHAWMLRMAEEARRWPPDDKGRHFHNGAYWCFAGDDEWPVLATVIRVPGTRGKRC